MTIAARRPIDGRSTVSVLPPPDVLALAELPELTRAVEHLVNLRTERRELHARREYLTAARRKAEHDDIEQAAAAHRQGRPDPGSPATAKVDAESKEVSRKEAVLDAAIGSATVDLAEVILAGRSEWMASLAAKAEKKREKVRRLAEQWAETRFEVAQVEALSLFLGNFPERSGYKQTGRRLHNSPETIDSILSTLIRDAEGRREAFEEAA